MDLLIILTYVAIAWSIFKIFKIPVNKWTVPTAALGGVFIVSALIIINELQPPVYLYRTKSGYFYSYYAAGYRGGQQRHG